MKKYLLLSVALVLMSGIALADETATNDCCNNACTCHWSYDAETKTINITGTGAMKNYGKRQDENEKWHTTAPWQIYEAEAESVNIAEGITSIGYGAFYYMPVHNVSIPTSVIKIETDAFQYADLTSVIIPEGVKKIGRAAFYHNLHLEEAILPSTLESIEEFAFEGAQFKTFLIPENVKELSQDIFDNGAGTKRYYKLEDFYCTSEQMDICEAALDYEKRPDVKPILYKKRGSDYLVYDNKGHIVGKYKDITSVTKQIPTEIYKYSDSGHFIGTFDAKGNRIGKKIYTVEEAMEATKYGDKFHVYLTYK